MHAIAKVCTRDRATGFATPKADGPFATLTASHAVSPSMKTADAIKVLSALAQESRLAIFRLLIEQGPEGLPVGAIGDRLGLANATLSFHLKELLHAGLVTSRQSGRFIFYAPVIAAMNGLVGYLTENCCAASGGQCLPTPVVKRATTKRAATAKPRRAKAS